MQSHTHHSEIGHNDCKRIIAETRKWILCDFEKVNYCLEGSKLVGQALANEFPLGPAPRNGKVIPFWKKVYYSANNGRNHAVSAPAHSTGPRRVRAS